MRASRRQGLCPCLPAVLLAALLIVGPASAAGTTPTRPAAPGCSVSVQDALFGVYDPSGPLPSNTIAQISVFCSGPTTLTILTGPSRTSGSSTDRRLRHRFRSDTLAYNLFQDAAYTRVWGDGAVGSPVSVNVTGRYTGQIFGQIYPGQDAWVGDYEDVVTITVLP
jgi:spore coat protein U-like protein